jgi:hypothetical protein
MKKHLTYCVTCHGKYKRTQENINVHRTFALSLENFEVSFEEINTEDYKNWGGMSGLLSMYLDTNPNLPEDGYLFSCEDDFMIKDVQALDNAINVLEEKSKTMNLAYVGHGSNSLNEHGYKTCADHTASFGDHCKWTDGGLYLFKNKKLLEIKNRLGVLPGHTKNNNDVPLPMDTELDFTNVTNRIFEHEVGFPTRLSYYGYDIWGIPNSQIIKNLNEEKVIKNE